MAGVARVGDILGKGGLLTFPFSPDVTVNGRPVALFGCIYTPHPPCSPKKPQHCFGPTFGIPEGVTVNGMIPLTKGSIGLCKDTVKTASDDVMIAGSMLGAALGMAAGFALDNFQADIADAYSGIDVSGLSDISGTIGDAFSGITGDILTGALGGGIEGALGAAVGAGIGAGVAATGLTGVGAQLATATVRGAISGGASGALSAAVGVGVNAGVSAVTNAAKDVLTKVTK